MKTDRELLELAAKAAGYTINKNKQAARDALIDPATACLWINSESTAWNPLTGDGEALRLAVKLGLSVKPFPAGARVRYQNHILDTYELEVIGDDVHAATRRAIVRAAASLGETP